MGYRTKIGWCDATWNPWRGCEDVSEGCTYCYAKIFARRNPGLMGEWGPKGTRVVASRKTFEDPIDWNMEARESGVRRRVFTCSIADFFEQWDGPMVDAGGAILVNNFWGPAPPPHLPKEFLYTAMDDVRLRAFDIIRRCESLDFLIVTKRIEHVVDTLKRLVIIAGLEFEATALWLREWVFGVPPANVWMIATAENQARADERIPILLEIPAAIRGVSYEPALGPVDWTAIGHGDQRGLNALNGEFRYYREHDGEPVSDWGSSLDWVIVGGESGTKEKARPFLAEWARDTIAQCGEAGVACYVKQMGTNPMPTHKISDLPLRHLRDPKGADPSEWPEFYRIHEFPGRRQMSLPMNY